MGTVVMWASRFRGWLRVFGVYGLGFQGSQLLVCGRAVLQPLFRNPLLSHERGSVMDQCCRPHESPHDISNLRLRSES